MNLFNYLMAKKGHNTSVRDDLLAYLLGKRTPKEVKTATGTTISITDAADLPVYEDKMSKESTQETTTGKQLFKDEYIPLPNTRINASLKAGTYCLSTVDGQTFNTNIYIKLSKNGQIVSEGGHLTSTILSNYSSSSYSYYGAAAYSSVTFTIDDDYDLYIGLLNSDNTRQVVLVEGTTIDRNYEPYTGGQPSPNPDYPQEVKTVKGYRNLFDKDNANVLSLYIHGSENKIYVPTTLNRKLIYISCKPNTNYIIKKISGKFFRVSTTDVVPSANVQTINRVINDTGDKITINSGENANYLEVNYYNSDIDTLTEQEILDSIMITEGTEELPYVPYGTNWIYIAVSNGTDTNYYTIPINNNELVGKLNNLDELIIDKHGQCFINKKFAKIDSYNGETITTDYWSTTGGLDTGSTIYYVLATPQLIDLNYTVDIELFEGVNNISNSDDMDMTLKYY